MRKQAVALAYSDVRLLTGHSEVTPNAVSLETRFSRNVPLKIPLVSAAMDRVTEYKLAIVIAGRGGIGVIHRNLTPKEQAAQVARVKFFLQGLIENPVCVKEDDTIESILKRREEKEWGFYSFPVVNGDGKLRGLLTKDDFELCDNPTLPAREVMTPFENEGLFVMPHGTTREAAYAYMKTVKKKVLPLVDEHGRITGMYIFQDLKRLTQGGSLPHNLDEHGRLRVAAAIGVGDDAFERVELLKRKYVDVVVIDSSHADTKDVLDTLRKLKRTICSDLDVVVGNVSSPDSATRLVDAGADGVKVGQGPGSICTTRIVAGTGCPQLTAVYECSEAIQGSGVPLCADGGIEFSGDVTIALGAGAHSVMMGKSFAGTKETPGKTITFQGMRWKDYRGMGSLGAMEEHQGSRERYGETHTERSKLISQGVEGMVPYQDEACAVLDQFAGGLRIGMGQVGAATIAELHQKAMFIRMTDGGSKESHVHGVVVSKEPPNYRTGIGPWLNQGNMSR